MAIDRDEVVRAAVRILDDYGLGDLSMRRVADALGVKAGALYWHVANKQSLLAAIADDLLSAVREPSGESAESLVEWARRLRVVLLAHRDSADLVATALASGLCVVDPLAAVVDSLTGRLGVPRADWAASALLHQVLGHVAHEQNVRLFRELGGVGGEVAGAPPEEAFDFAVEALVRGLLG